MRAAGELKKAIPPVFAIVLLAMVMSAAGQRSSGMAQARVPASSECQVVLEHLPSVCPEGFEMISAPEIYKREELFNFMDGGAELYLEFDTRCCVVTYFRSKDSETSTECLSVDIYLMATAEDAFGLFSILEKDAEEPGLRGGWLAKGRDWVLARAGRVVAKFILLDEKTCGQSDLMLFALNLKSAFVAPCSLPPLFALLPRRGLVKHSITFFHGPISAKRIMPLYLIPRLGLSKKTDVLAADYIQRDKEASIYLARYDSIAAASEAFRSVIGSYQPRPEKGERKYKKPLLAVQCEDLLILAIDKRGSGLSQILAKEVLSAANCNQGARLPPKPDGSVYPSSRPHSAGR